MGYCAQNRNYMDEMLQLIYEIDKLDTNEQKNNMQTSAWLITTPTDRCKMESTEKRDELLGGIGKMHNAMEIFSSLSLADNSPDKIGQGDQLDTRIEGNHDFPQIASLPPSEYMRQLSMTTEERIELLTRVRPENQQVPHDLLESNDFEVVPRTLLFQHYTPGNVYNVPLIVRNTGKTSRYLKLACEIDPAFTVAYQGTSTLNTRLAPEMFNTYNVKFEPNENRDYEYEIKFLTDREVFAVPVIGIGPRAILDFPDLVVVPETAVNITSIKSLLVRNLGDSVAVFNTSTTSTRFWLEPSKGMIEQEETIQFAVNFSSSRAGFFKDCFFLKYESGEVIRIRVHGSAIDCNVRLERGSMRMQEETYIGLSTSKTLKILNRSEYIVKYRWMRYRDSETDTARKKEYERIFGLINEAEIVKCMDLVHYNVCLPKAHELVCQRIYADEMASLGNEHFHYKNSHFSLTPMEGEIWPHNSAVLTVNFEPDEIGELSSTAYLEVTGREDRLPLSLSGVSIGPLIKLNVATIDVKNIFLCSVHNYQVVCTNKGFIPGVLVHKAKRSDFGGCVTVTPQHLKLQPGQYGSFNVSFSSNRNGDFVERVEFVIKESLQIVALYIKGCVVCPTLRFDKTRLDFGTVAIGFNSKREVVLYNDSSVSVTFSVSVLNDGSEAVVTAEDFARAPGKPSFPSSPREFVVAPADGIVAANSSLKINISFTPNAARVGETSLRVDMWDTDSVSASLPISFRSKVASMIVKPGEIDITSSFLNHPYTRNFTVENESDVDGYFYLVPQTISDCTTMLYSMSVHQGYLGAGQSRTVSLTIITRAMGNQRATMSMLTFGEKAATTCCVLTCNGQGPVVSVHPTSLDWARVLLLREQTMVLTLINNSPVPAEFTAAVVSKDSSSWKIFPSSGDLNPGEPTILEVTAFLRDVGKHSDKIVLTIPNSRNIAVPLSAIGIGSCVVCKPTIFPTFDMDLLFSRQDNGLPIDVTNHGSRTIRLVFSNTMALKILRGQIQAPTYETFSVEPFSIELPAETTGTVICNARSDTCETVSEQWWLHCFYDGQGKREILGNSNFTAKFVDASVSFSKRELTFVVNVSPGMNESRQTDELTVVNTSGLELNARLSVDPPFGIITENGEDVQSLEIVLSENAKCRVGVFFSPVVEKGQRHSKEYSSILKLEYKEHPNADKIKCRASLNFPNVSSLPREIRFDCSLGCSVVKNIFLKNDGPLEVSYKFTWIEETISIRRDSSNIEEESKNCSIASPNAGEDQSEYSELLAETRKLLVGILANNLALEEPEVVALEILGNESLVADEINQIFSIVPCESVIPGYSCQCISFGFHGTEALTIEAQVLCEIEGGPTELIKVIAAADEVRFILDKERVDFEQQIICEPSRGTLKLENLSNIQLNYDVDGSDESLTIQPIFATIAARSIVEIALIYRAVVPGPFEKTLRLCIDHRLPISIIVEGFVVIPQVCVSLPRGDLFKDRNVELGYRALQSLRNWSHFYDNLEEIENGWQMVMKDEKLPGVVDIEMVVESLIAKEFIEESYSLMLDRTRGSKVDGPIPCLYAPEYIIEMGYVVVGQTAQASTRVYNYGSRNAQVRLSKSKKSKDLAKQGIKINFRNQTSLMPGEYVNLEVTLNPMKLKSSEKSATIRSKFYLEVTNGFTLPIIVSATVTYPYVTVNPKILEFSEVLVGECALLHILIKNEGLIDCQWEAKLPPIRRNQSEGPFRLLNGTDVYSSGQSGSIKIYFKPRKSGYAESKLSLHIHQGVEPIIIDLRGRGVEHKLKLSPPLIKFSSVLPHDSSQGREFIIENSGQRTVELYWQHLKDPALHENRVIRVLAHYYQVDEILLPPRRPPDSSSLPPQLLDFYDSLVDEMSILMATQRKKNAKQIDKGTAENYSEEERVAEQDSVSVATRRKKKGSNTRKLSRKISRNGSITTVMSEANMSLSVLSELEVSGRRSNLSHDDPDKIETLLHVFIDELQKQPDFFEKMKDPVKEMFDAVEKKESLRLEQSEGSSLTSNKRVCIIFHGAASTEYQSAACKASRILGLPLLNLNKALIEMIALGNTACSAKLRETIDNKYKNLPPRREKSRTEDGIKISSVEELGTMDSLTRYECKIETLKWSLEKVRTAPVTRGTPRGGKGSVKERAKSPKSPRVRTEETFLDIDIRMLIELLEQRLSMADMSQGFVLQSLNNDFIHDDVRTLTLLLEILGNVEYPIFVTFRKPLEFRESRNAMEAQSPDEGLVQLTNIDEMSSSEFDLLSIAEKELYRDKVLLVRSEEASRRRLQYKQRISELRKQRHRASSKDKRLRGSKKSKSVVLQSRQDLDKAILGLSDKKKNSKVDIAKSSERQTIPVEMKTIADRVDAYDASLEAILSILRNWDPSLKSSLPSQKESAQSKVSRNPKTKDRPATASSKTRTEVKDRFWIWHVDTTDPWNPKTCDMIVSQLAKHESAHKDATLDKIGVETEPNRLPQVYYSVALPKIRETVEPRSSVQQTKAFDLFAVKYNAASNSIDGVEITDSTEEPVESQLVLESHEYRTFVVYFAPKHSGLFNDEFSLGILNSNEASYRIKVTGSGDVPRLNMDPSCIFKKIKGMKKDELNDPTFFTETQTFDFGALLLAAKDNKAHRKKTSFKLWNPSKMDVELEVSLASSNWKTFDVERRQLLIESGEFGVIDVTASATKLGVNEERLVLLVKNNPRVEVIELRSNGTKLDVELEGNQISFGKVLLHRQVKKNVEVRNNSAIPIFWRLASVDPIDSQLKISSTVGKVKARADSNVVFSYTANRIGLMDEAKLSFKVYLDEDEDYEEPLFIDTVKISGETYDVAVDIDSANPIALESTRVGSIVSSSFTVRNRGRYDVKFMIEFEKSDRLPAEIDRDLRKSLKEDLQISPPSGIVPPDKLITIDVNYLPKIEMRLKEVPLLKCNIIDTNNDGAIVAEFPLTVSITAHYAKYRLIPDSEIDFGPTSLCSEKTLHLSIENIGMFPFKYQLKNPLLPAAIEEGSMKKKKDKSPRSAATNKQGTTKSRDAVPNLRMGPFTLPKIEGNIEPGAMETLAVDCYPETEGRLEERVLVIVENSVPENMPGESLLLSVDSCLPSIDFHDLDTIFQDSYVVEFAQDFICPKEIEAHTIFSRGEKCLYFERVTINNTHTTIIRLHNRGIVPARVTVSLRPDGLTPKNARPDTFALDSVRESIAPMSSQIFSVSFTPSLIETYTGVLEAAVELPVHLRNEPDNKLSVKLSGEGCVPEVTLMEPPVVNRGGNSTIGFGRCLIDETSSKNLCLKNTGKITVRVVVEIINDFDQLYVIRACEEPVLRYFAENDLTDSSEDVYEHEERTAVCTVTPGDIARFFIDFRPRDPGRRSARVRLIVLDNPYENMTIMLDGEGFAEDVVVEGLPLLEMPRAGMPDGSNGKARKSLRHRSGASLAGSSITITSMNLASAPSLVYKLDYGTCFVNRMNQLNFKILNKSGERYFRFEWSSHPNLVFVPSTGHLQRSGSKDIVATFLAAGPMIHKQTIIECAICEIEFPGEREETNVWDDRQSNVEWLEVDPSHGNENIFEGIVKKIVVPSTEPAHEIVPGTARTIQLMLSAIVAHSEYSCAIQEINFEDTLIFQNSEYTFSLENPGNVDLIVNCKIDMDAEYPTRLPDSALRAAALRPRSAQSNDSRPSSRSSGKVLYPGPERRNYNHDHSRTQRNYQLVNYFKPVSRNKFYAIDIEPSDCPCPPTSDLFSNSVDRTQKSTESWFENGDDQPFSIKPERIVIPPRGSGQFTLRFCPLDVFDYKAYLTCRIENLSPDLEQLTIPLTGRSLLPYCHFDLEESDYLTSGRRDTGLTFPALGCGDSNDLPGDFAIMRVLEFKIVGIGESHSKKFHLVNPTTEDYRFTWKDLTPRGAEDLPIFQCSREEGLAESGKRTDVVFSFYAEDFGTFESFWRFSIDRYKLETVFLLVAVVTEPLVKCPNAMLKMMPTILRSKVEDSIVIVNDEELPLAFKVLPNSLFSEDGSFQKLTVAPRSGILEAKSEQILQVSFEPSRIGDFTFPLRCQIKSMKNPLSILVSARVVKIMSRVSYSADKQPQRSNEVREDCETILDFGKLTLNTPSTIKFEIANVGDVAFNYMWDVEMEHCGDYIITISHSRERVPSDTKATCYLELMALQKTVIRQHPVVLRIEKGPIYRMSVRASAKLPSVEFSFVKYDFGPCYIRDETLPAYVAHLFVTNNDKTPAIVECNFAENLTNMTMDLEALSEAIPGHSTVTVPIHFRPLEQLHYKEHFTFIIKDSTVRQTISLKGEGISYMISLENIRDKSIDFGNVPVGKTITRKVRILNAGRAPAELRFDVAKNLPGYGEHTRRSNARRDESRLGSTTRSTKISKLNDTNVRDETLTILGETLAIQPRHIVLPATNSIELVLKFTPTKRLTSFVEKIGAQVDATIVPLLFVRGSCVDREFRLSRTKLYFGRVVEGCSTETKLVLHNTGDFGAKFKWNVDKLKPTFHLRPISGYCSPGMDVTFTVSFHPLQVASMLEAEASIDIEKYESLRISCSGACCKIPDSVEVLRFLVPVRSKQTRDLKIANDTSFAWNVQTIITGEYFHGEEVFSVPAKKSYSYSLTYAPLIMNNEKNPHQGRLLVKLPENKPPLVYTLVGVSLPPEVAGKIVRQLPAKTRYVELLPVHNWLDKSQSFRCDIKPIGDQKANPVLYSFTGNSKLDVTAYGSRDFRAVFHCYKETTLNFQIKFTNDGGEYQFYDVQYKVSKPEVLSTIKLTTAARSTTCCLIKMENPLEDGTVTFSANCEHRDITIRGVPKVVSAKTSDNITVDYSPIVSGESVAKIDINCPELGNFPYELRLKATPAAAGKVIRVTAVLGCATIFPVVISNISSKSVRFVIKVDDPSFTCDKTISVAPHKEANLEVTYEPCDAKNVTATLCASSESLGEMLFPLIGSYSLPKPQGPFTVSRNSSVSIVFKNVFSVTKTFEYTVDGDAFSILTSSDVIKSKLTATIVVKFRNTNDSLDGSPGKTYPVTGKLIISCVEPSLSNILWVYYLRGVTE